jgi:hypothetical protein
MDLAIGGAVIFLDEELAQAEEEGGCQKDKKDGFHEKGRTPGIWIPGILTKTNDLGGCFEPYRRHKNPFHRQDAKAPRTTEDKSVENTANKTS